MWLQQEMWLWHTTLQDVNEDALQNEWLLPLFVSIIMICRPGLYKNHGESHGSFRLSAVYYWQSWLIKKRYLRWTQVILSWAARVAFLFYWTLCFSVFGEGQGAVCWWDNNPESWHYRFLMSLLVYRRMWEIVYTARFISTGVKTVKPQVEMFETTL